MEEEKPESVKLNRKQGKAKPEPSGANRRQSRRWVAAATKWTGEKRQPLSGIGGGRDQS